MWRVTKGRVKIRLDDAIEEVGGFIKIDAGEETRFGVVEDLAEPFSHMEAAKYKVGSRVMIPNTGGKFFEQDGNTYVVLLQSEVVMYDTETKVVDIKSSTPSINPHEMR